MHDKEDKHNLILQKEHRYENMATDAETTFTFTTSYEDTTSLSLATSSGWTVGIACNLSAGAMGVNLGVGPSFNYSRSKNATRENVHGETRTLQMTGKVPAGEVAIVTELIYNTLKHNNCEVKLRVDKEIEVPYLLGTATKNVRVSKLIDDLMRRNTCITKDDKSVVFHLNGRCQFRHIDHSLRLHKILLDEDRRKAKTPSKDVSQRRRRRIRRINK